MVQKLLSLIKAKKKEDENKEIVECPFCKEKIIISSQKKWRIIKIRCYCKKSFIVYKKKTKLIVISS